MSTESSKQNNNAMPEELVGIEVTDVNQKAFNARIEYQKDYIDHAEALKEEERREAEKAAAIREAEEKVAEAQRQEELKDKKLNMWVDSKSEKSYEQFRDTQSEIAKSERRDHDSLVHGADRSALLDSEKLRKPFSIIESKEAALESDDKNTLVSIYYKDKKGNVVVDALKDSLEAFGRDHTTETIEKLASRARNNKDREALATINQYLKSRYAEETQANAEEIATATAKRVAPLKRARRMGIKVKTANTAIAGKTELEMPENNKDSKETFIPFSYGETQSSEAHKRVYNSETTKESSPVPAPQESVLKNLDMESQQKAYDYIEDWLDNTLGNKVNAKRMYAQLEIGNRELKDVMSPEQFEAVLQKFVEIGAIKVDKAANANGVYELLKQPKSITPEIEQTPEQKQLTRNVETTLLRLYSNTGDGEGYSFENVMATLKRDGFDNVDDDVLTDIFVKFSTRVGMKYLANPKNGNKDFYFKNGITDNSIENNVEARGLESEMAKKDTDPDSDEHPMTDSEYRSMVTRALSKEDLNGRKISDRIADKYQQRRGTNNKFMQWQIGESKADDWQEAARAALIKQYKENKNDSDFGQDESATSEPETSNTEQAKAIKAPAGLTRNEYRDSLYENRDYDYVEIGNSDSGLIDDNEYADRIEAAADNYEVAQSQSMRLKRLRKIGAAAASKTVEKAKSFGDRKPKDQDDDENTDTSHESRLKRIGKKAGRLAVDKTRQAREAIQERRQRGLNGDEVSSDELLDDDSEDEHEKAGSR